MTGSEAATSRDPLAARPVGIACAQLDGRDADPTRRRADARAAILRGAAAARTSAVAQVLVVLPELWPVGFFHFDDYRSAAEGLDGPAVSTVREAARETGAWVLGGSIVEGGAAGLHNTSILVSPDGDVELAYRKIHLFGHESSEAELLTAGDEPRCADTPWGRVGVMTCYDIRFPELTRDLVNRGAEMLLVVSAWPAARVEHWSALLRARAIESQAWVVAANGAGVDAGVRLGGRSAVIAPDGSVVSEAGAAEQDLVCAVDAAASARTRAELPFLGDRRYSVTLEP
ncbi:MAG: nitrilase-related carbon-nitrogen hydrolase [Nocardioidaceae bacterium]